MEKLIVVDGNSIMNRAFYGLMSSNMMKNSEGLFTNAIFGFLSILLKLINEDKPDYLAIAFDLKAPTFRKEMYEGYKANRKGMPNELAVQMPVIKEVIDAMNIHRIEVEGFEADDILGTLAKKAEKNNIKTVLFTGDRDSFQLISPNIDVKMPVTKAGKTEIINYNEEKINEVYGITPVKLIEVKALMGDASDNIPGVPGIGEKTALTLIQNFGSLAGVYENIDSTVIKPKARESLTNFKEQAELSRKLAEIEVNMPLEVAFDELRLREYNKDELFNILKRLEFNSFIKKLNLEHEAVIKEHSYEVITADDKRLENIQEEIAIYIDSDNKYIVFSGNKIGNLLLKLDGNQSKVKEILENENIKKIVVDYKSMILRLRKMGIEISGVDFDVALAAFLLNSSKANPTIESIANDYLGEELTFTKKNSQITMFSMEETVDEDELKYFAAVSDCILSAKEILDKKLKEQEQDKLYQEIELPLARVLADMEQEGILVDKARLNNYSEELAGKIAELDKEIKELAGKDFNINSPKQLSEVLFEELQLPAGKKTKTGYSTDNDVLEAIKSEHKIVDKILMYRQLVKLKSTYLDGLYNVINPNTGRIHSNFNQMVTVTGRLSSTEPNLQNIPIKIEAGKKVREMFIPKEGYVFIDADYSQIELRVLADIAQNDAMIEAFNNDEDIHTATAMSIFDLPKDEITPPMRSRAKAVNFGIVYGQSDFTLAKDLGISRKEAKGYIEAYFEKFSGIKKYLEDTINTTKEKGYAVTLFNRRRYVPELSSNNFNVRSFGERIAMNMPIQGTAADIIKIAMIKIHSELKNMESRLILQVHDEVLVETKKEEVEEVKQIIKRCMQDAVKLRIILKADINEGENWLQAH